MIDHLQTEKPLLSFEDWKKELIELTAKETGKDISSIKLNNEGSYEWWKDGFTPYATFRETY